MKWYNISKLGKVVGSWFYYNTKSRSLTGIDEALVILAIEKKIEEKLIGLESHLLGPKHQG